MNGGGQHSIGPKKPNKALHLCNVYLTKAIQHVPIKHRNGAIESFPFIETDEPVPRIEIGDSFSTRFDLICWASCIDCGGYQIRFLRVLTKLIKFTS